MKKYETDFFWSFKDGEAKYENGITELFYENKKIGKGKDWAVWKSKKRSGIKNIRGRKKIPGRN